MDKFFSIGELARYQNISKQTLIFYDRIGLFTPEYVNPDNGYRYYGAKQLDQLDTIFIMKGMGLSLREIKQYLAERDFSTSQAWMEKQLEVLEQQLSGLQSIRDRIAHKWDTMREYQRVLGGEQPFGPVVGETESLSLLSEPVDPPYDLVSISIATKRCLVKAMEGNLPIAFQMGVRIPMEWLERGRYTQASHAFILCAKELEGESIWKLPAGPCVTAYHQGDYGSTGETYARLFAFCRQRGLALQGDAFEFCIHDHITAGDDQTYLTKMLCYIDPEVETAKGSSGTL